MNIKLSFGQKPWKGYLNIDPDIDVEPDKILEYDVHKGKIGDFMHLVENAECDDIYCDNVLEYLFSEGVLDFVTHLCGKLRKGGSITFIGVDLFIAAQEYVNGQIDTVTFNDLIHGDSKMMKAGQITMGELVDILESNGLTITQKRFEKFNYIVGARRLVC